MELPLLDYSSVFLVTSIKWKIIYFEFEAREARGRASVVTHMHMQHMYTAGVLQLPCTFGLQSEQQVSKELSSFPNSVPPFFY